MGEARLKKAIALEEPPEFAQMARYGGIPVPFTVPWVGDVPDFHGISWDLIEECLNRRLCGVCGGKLGYWIAFVGGPNSVATRAFQDAPMHEACARWALQNCPYLTGQGRTEPRIKRPEKLGLFITRSYKLVQVVRTGMKFIRPDPSRRIEWFGGPNGAR
jgi:hypothetical protein